jgi:hypothetical protein
MTLWRGAIDWRRAVPPALALLITLYGGLLRLDAFAGKYPPLDHPRWARILTQDIAPLGASLRPSSIVWKKEARPYLGGDPTNYLRFAREMKGFYDAHVREPVFLALTRGWLWALDGQDAAVGFASLTGSTLVVFAAYLLGSAVLSPFAGLLAALLVAIEHEMITWAPDGWRDDTFTATVAFAAWALIRLYRRPSTRNALIAGGVCGLACLTRVTALSFIIPGLLWFIAAPARSTSEASDTYPGWRERARCAAVALAMCALVLGPFLINCAIATGDPFFAINYHTTYYRYAEGRSINEPLSATAYVAAKFREQPLATLDTAFQGLFIQPFVEKWRGFAPWLPGLDSILRTLAVVGLGACAFFSTGRLMLVLLVTSLVPYMVTWNVGGGNEWRFTMPAYPFYLVAVASVLVGAIRTPAWVRSHGPRLGRTEVFRLAAPAVILGALVALGTSAYVLLPWFVAEQAIARGEETSLETGPRDRAFYRDGWSPPHKDGVVARISGRRSSIRIPLAPGRNYEIVLRMDPVDPASQSYVSVMFNGHYVGRPRLSWDPTRVGSYRVPVRAAMVRRTNELTIIPESLVTAAAAGPRFAWMDPEASIGVRLWYVRVLPSP